MSEISKSGGEKTQDNAAPTEVTTDLQALTPSNATGWMYLGHVTLPRNGKPGGTITWQYWTFDIDGKTPTVVPQEGTTITIKQRVNLRSSQPLSAKQFGTLNGILDAGQVAVVTGTPAPPVPLENGQVGIWVPIKLSKENAPGTTPVAEPTCAPKPIPTAS
jgi:hypothetical protein